MDQVNVSANQGGKRLVGTVGGKLPHQSHVISMHSLNYVRLARRNGHFSFPSLAFCLSAAALAEEDAFFALNNPSNFWTTPHHCQAARLIASSARTNSETYERIQIL